MGVAPPEIAQAVNAKDPPVAPLIAHHVPEVEGGAWRQEEEALGDDLLAVGVGDLLALVLEPAGDGLGQRRGRQGLLVLVKPWGANEDDLLAKIGQNAPGDRAISLRRFDGAAGESCYFLRDRSYRRTARCMRMPSMSPSMTMRSSSVVAAR